MATGPVNLLIDTVEPWAKGEMAAIVYRSLHSISSGDMAYEVCLRGQDVYGIYTALFSFDSVSHHGVPIPVSPLDDSLNVACHPPAVEISGLRLDFLSVNIAVPRPGVERQMILDGGKRTRGLLVGPDAVGDGRRR